jgi:putative restriction endonuclease
MCKIHHAAYDRNILGISSDYLVHVRQDILDEVDGPMLRYGLQQMDRGVITVPRSRSARPDRERLSVRYDQFVRA